MQKNNDGQHRTPGYGPGAANDDNGQRRRMHDERNRTPHSHEETLERDFPTSGRDRARARRKGDALK